MRSLLNLLPFLFLLAAAFSGYTFYTAESGLLKLIPLTIGLCCAFIVSLAWRVSPQGFSRKTGGICFLLLLVTALIFYFNPAYVRTVWIIMSILVLISIHAALFSMAAASFLFTEGRRVILLLPVISSFIGLAGLFLWNGSLVLSGIGLIAAIIFALLATLFGLPKKKSGFNPENN